MDMDEKTKLKILINIENNDIDIAKNTLIGYAGIGSACRPNNIDSGRVQQCIDKNIKECTKTI